MTSILPPWAGRLVRPAACVLAALAVTPILLAADVPAGGGTKGKKKKPPVDVPIRAIDPAAAAQVSFSKQVMPLLTAKCLDCHDPKENDGEYQVTSHALVMKGGETGAAVVPGKPDESLMVQYLRGQTTPQMPKGEQPITVDELHLIRSWIAAGAKDDTGAAGAGPATKPAK